MEMYPTYFVKKKCIGSSRKVARLLLFVTLQDTQVQLVMCSFKLQEKLACVNQYFQIVNIF